jgi:hypothetical protein
VKDPSDVTTCDVVLVGAEAGAVVGVVVSRSGVGVMAGVDVAGTEVVGAGGGVCVEAVAGVGVEIGTTTEIDSVGD